MSTLYSTTGIILSRRDFRESDRQYSVFTPSHGKIEFLARGGHKPLAKLTPHLEMVAEVELLLVNGRTFQTIAGVERRRRFINPNADLSSLLLAQSSLSLVDLAVRSGERDPILYDLLIKWLEFVAEVGELTDERSAFLLGSFVLKLMSICGYQPELSVCLACRCLVAPGAFRWHALKGGVVCEACGIKNEEQWFNARRIDDDTLKLMRYAIFESFEAQMRPALKTQNIAYFHDTLESYLITHFPVIPAVSIRTACATSVCL